MIIIVEIKTMSLVLDTKVTLSSVVWRNGKIDNLYDKDLRMYVSSTQAIIK